MKNAMKNLIPVKQKDKTTHLIPVRVTETEYKKIYKAAIKAGDRYMNRFMRRAAMEAAEKP